MLPNNFANNFVDKFITNYTITEAFNNFVEDNPKLTKIRIEIKS